MSVTRIHELILKDGLRQFKFKNSKYKGNPSEEQKGAVFSYSSKSRMTSGRGLVLTSFEAVCDLHNKVTHWTPNVYRYGTYTEGKTKITKGHSEHNLRQINTFYVDIDIKHQKEKFNYSDILVSSLDLGFMPTLILKTDNGYQVYFVLEDAAYVTATNDFKVVKVAKMISQNIRLHYQKTLPVDMTCNHFGIARMPRKDNIEYIAEDNIYSFAEWFKWSMQQDDFEYSKKPYMSLLSGTEGKKQIDEPWYHLLKNTVKIKGEKSLLGRNNVIFTMALACYSSGVSQEGCAEELSEFNQKLTNSLTSSELKKIIRSAYSDRYEAASRDFIKTLCHTWIDSSLTAKDLFVRQGWYKFKKARGERQRSHFSEWGEDLLAYIENNTSQDDPYVRTTKKDLRSLLNIPERSLDYVLKALKDSNKLFYAFKRGRGGGITIASVASVMLSLINMNREARLRYYDALSDILGGLKSAMISFFETILLQEKGFDYDALFELDTG